MIVTFPSEFPRVESIFLLYFTCFYFFSAPALCFHYTSSSMQYVFVAGSVINYLLQRITLASVSLQKSKSAISLTPLSATRRVLLIKSLSRNGKRKSEFALILSRASGRVYSDRDLVKVSIHLLSSLQIQNHFHSIAPSRNAILDELSQMEQAFVIGDHTLSTKDIECNVFKGTASFINTGISLMLKQ